MLTGEVDGPPVERAIGIEIGVLGAQVQHFAAAFDDTAPHRVLPQGIAIEGVEQSQQIALMGELEPEAHGAGIKSIVTEIDSEVGRCFALRIEFVTDLLEPDVIAGATNYTYYANANVPAKEFVLPEILEDPAIYPDEATLKRGFPSVIRSQELNRVITREWTRIKTGQ